MEALESAPPPRKPKKKNTRDLMGPGSRGPDLFGAVDIIQNAKADNEEIFQIDLFHLGRENEAQHNLRVAADAPRGKVPRHFMGTCPSLASSSPVFHPLHGQHGPESLKWAKPKPERRHQGKKPAETMVPANAVLQAWRTKPTPNGKTRVKMLRNINRRQPGSPSNGIPADCRSATFGARDALHRIDTHKDDILESLGIQQAFVLAGFNEDYIQEGIGLLQEIHILACEDLDLDESALAAVGKACTPFPSVIFMPSGRCFRPPLYDKVGKDVPFSTLGDSVCRLRYSLAIDKALSLAEERIGGTVPSHHATSGNVPTSEEALPTSNRSGEVAPAIIGQNAISNQSTSVEEAERGTSHPQNSAQGPKARESPPQRLDLGALPQDPPEPDDGTATERLRNIYLELHLAIQRSDSEKDPSPEQKIQLLANFGFQLDQGKSATVKFTELACSEATPSSKHDQGHYLHRYLKVLVDPQSQKWRASHCSPKRTPAGLKEIKAITTVKDSSQYGTKFKASLVPSISLENSFASENSKAKERVELISGITQKKSAEGYTWGFEVDDAREQQQGLQLSDDKLPSLSLVYLPDARQPYNSDIPEELTVEISAFWSLGLPTRSNGWLSMLQGQYIPKFSNFVHSVRVDLRADMDCDGHFVGEQKVGGGIPERREVDTRSLDILVTTGIQMLGNRHPEEVPRWLPKQYSK